jgi:preprotein translocase SecE subunit
MAKAMAKKVAAGPPSPDETPKKPRKGAAPEAPPPTGAQGQIEEAKKYLKSVQTESKRITWPTQQQMKAFVAVVLVTLIVVTAYLFICDVVFTKIFAWLISMLSHK